METKQVTEYDVIQAVWQAWYHLELDELYKNPDIDGSDSPAIVKIGKAIFDRLEVPCSP